MTKWDLEYLKPCKKIIENGIENIEEICIIKNLNYLFNYFNHDSSKELMDIKTKNYKHIGRNKLLIAQ